MKNGVYAALGVIAFLWFGGFFLYAAGFLLNLYVPKSVDSGSVRSVGYALGVNVLLIVLFGLQHSVMARRSFKALVTRVIPPFFERTFYVLSANLTLTLMLCFWEPMTTPVWSVETPWLQTALYALFAVGALIVVHALWAIDLFEYIGLRQILFHLRHEAYRPVAFKTPALYRYVRHPMYAGTLMVFWATPEMTLGHLFLAVGMTLYTLVGVWFEERDLHALYGDDYKAYAQRVGRLVPKWKRR